jgi:hypothetical protein
VADWRQIQARIRKAKAAPDPLVKLAELFDRTRDGMVAFELGRQYEENAQNEQALAWYGKAAERFRRPVWKRKAAEALARLGGVTPAVPKEDEEQAVKAEKEDRPGGLSSLPFSEEHPAERIEEEAESDEAAATAEEIAAPAGDATGGAPPSPAERKRRRRGRRGGRGRRRKPPAAQAQTTPSAPLAAPVERQAARAPSSKSLADAPAPTPAALREPESIFAEIAARPESRAGEPALASRMAKLESQLRRLVTAAAHPVEKHEEAPAGPGVLLISDADGVTHYYAEACRTLRIGLAQLLKSGRRSKGEGSLRAQLAEHLGISESKVNAYLNRHCVVRWLQIDDGAPHLAHFVIAVLRPVLNE